MPAGPTVEGSERSWRDQWRRMMRSLDALEQAGAPGTRATDDVADAVAHFFADCWHLGDWLVHDESTTITRSTLTTHVDLSRPLQLCGAVVAGFHAVRSSRLPSVAASAGATASVAAAGPSGESFYVHDGTARHDVVELAHQAIADWRDLLRANDLLPPVR